jgi:hypothetical protein
VRRATALMRRALPCTDATTLKMAPYAGAEGMRPMWEHAKRTGGPLLIGDGYGPMENVPEEWFDIPGYAERGPASLNVLANDKNMELLRAIVGDDLALSQIQARTYPPQSTDQQRHGGYAGWHRDTGGPTGVNFEHPERALRVKCFVFLFDTPPDCGCTCVVPGSHRWRFGAGDEL